MTHRTGEKVVFNGVRYTLIKLLWQDDNTQQWRALAKNAADTTDIVIPMLPQATEGGAG